MNIRDSANANTVTVDDKGLVIATIDLMEACQSMIKRWDDLQADNEHLRAVNADLLAACKEAREVMESLLVGSIPESERINETDRVTGNLATAIALAEPKP